MSNKGKILIFRFSALGDVAMTIPVIAALIHDYPEKEIVMVSRPFAKELLAPFSQITFIALDARNKHKGFTGLWRLFRELQDLGPYDYIADLHNVLRTKILRFFFRIAGFRCYKIDKGRKEKKALVRKNNKQLKPLKSTFERYRDVFAAAGETFTLKDFNIQKQYIPSAFEAPHAAFNQTGHHIGIAPFAGHQWKTWPEEKMRQLISGLAAEGHQVYLFGGRGKEQQTLESWASEIKQVHSLAGRLSISDELKAMSLLNVMISMDSANMHLARLVNTPVVSLWGATHPYAGFYGWQQPIEWAVQADLSCRPCSVFGNKKCYRGDFACMQRITPEMVKEKINLIITQ